MPTTLSRLIDIGYRRIKMMYMPNEHRPRVLRIFELKSAEVAGGWRKLHKEELHNSCLSPSVIRMINSRRMR
jgi:hypothetical protein